MRNHGSINNMLSAVAAATRGPAALWSVSLAPLAGCTLHCPVEVRESPHPLNTTLTITENLNYKGFNV